MTLPRAAAERTSYTPEAEPARPGAPADAPFGAPRVAVWVALLTGLAEAGSVAWRHQRKELLTHADPQMVWAAPLSYLILFAPIALILARVGRRRGPAWELRAALTTFGALGLFGYFSADERLHPAALLVLAIGVAMQVGLLAARHRRVAVPVLRGTKWAMGALVALLATVVNMAPIEQERRANAALPAARAGAPNVLLIILDTVRSASLSLHGYARRTSPTLEALGARGTVFDRAISPAPWTLPAHVAIFTGRWPHQMRANWRRGMRESTPTLTQRLAERGYRTGGFIANTEYVARETGLARGFARYRDFRLSPLGLFTEGRLAGWALSRSVVRDALGLHDLPGRKLAPQVNAELLEWLDEGERDRPFFAFLNYYDAHNPYLPPAPYDTLFGADPDSVNYDLRQDSLLTPAQARKDRDAYDAAIAYLDAQIGRLLDSLSARGALENTIVVVTADHGEEFAEHGVLGHGATLYLPALHVPLLVVAPGRVPAGVRVADAVSTRDIAATVLDLVDGGPDARMPGRSLARCWDAGRAGLGPCADTILAEVRYAANSPAFVPLSRGDMFSILAGGRHLIRDGAGEAELFDVRRDPFEVRDLAGEPQYRDVARQLDASLRTVASPQ